MCPELCVRRLVTSPVIQTWPISFSSSRRTLEVSSETVRTRRVASGGNNSPKSHWLCALLPIADERLGNAVDAPGATGDFIDVDHHALQVDAIFGDAEALRGVGDETLDDRFNFPAENAFVGAGEAGVAQKSGAAGKNLFIGGLHVRVRAD